MIDEEVLFTVLAVTYVCSCLIGFVMSLNWLHQCPYRGCIHKPRGEGRNHK